MNVCLNCFADEGLRNYIKENASRRSCSFCKVRHGARAAVPFEELVEFMSECISEMYEDAANWLPYDSAEGGYQGAPYYSTYELLTEELDLDLPNDKDGRLLNAICDALGDPTWCDADPFALPEQDRLTYSWEQFSNLVKYSRRYFFLRSSRRERDPNDELLGATDLLEKVGEACDELGLFIQVPKGSLFWRARFQEPGTTLSGPLDLGPPPPEHAIRANRMNPPGVPMLYVADDKRTALAETFDRPGVYVFGEFRIDQDIHLLDLTCIPEVPGFFEPPRQRRQAIIFLRRLAEMVSRPLTRDDRVHLEYVPSQVFTEFFRVRKEDLHGIAYRSATVPQSRSYVLYATRADLVLSEAEEKTLTPSETWVREQEGHDPWVSLVSHHSTQFGIAGCPLIPAKDASAGLR